MSVKTSTFESWKKTNKYLPIYCLNIILTCQDLQEVGGKITSNKCVHYRFQEFEIISHCWTCTKQTYWIFIIDSQGKNGKKKHDNNSLEIQAKSCDFILNPDQQSHTQTHLTELQYCQYLAMAAVANSKHSLLQLSQQNGSRLWWSRNQRDQCLINTLQTEDFAYIIQVYMMLNSSLHGIMNISKIQLVVYYQGCILIGWATTRL